MEEFYVLQSLALLLVELLSISWVWNSEGKQDLLLFKQDFFCNISLEENFDKFKT